MEHTPSAEPEPKNFHLLPGERIINFQEFEPRRPTTKPSSIRELLRLTNASSIAHVGESGPAVAALELETPGQTRPEHQGLFNAVFGRDSLRVAINLVDHYPRLTRSTIKKLAKFQGTTYHEAREEEPGRIAHEIRSGNDPIAKQLTKERGWGWPYYGSVDATPEFVRTIGEYVRSSGDSSFLFEKYQSNNGEAHEIHKAMSKSVDWIITKLDSNNEGLIEYQTVLDDGIENQVWKDSYDAYHHQDGRLADHDQGISSIEVQVSAHEALIEAADIYDNILHDSGKAGHIRHRADNLARTILDEFWTDEDDGYFVVGCDRDALGQLRQLKIRTSNMGHLLNSRILDGNSDEAVHKRGAILRQLQSPSMLAAGGIRTLAADEVRYREGAYHNGSVWVWDTHHIAKGARRFSSHPQFLQFADDLDQRILNIVQKTGGFPEYVRGSETEILTNTRIIDVYDSINNKRNRVEQPPQEVQAWSVSAVLAAKLQIGRQAIFSSESSASKTPFVHPKPS